MLPYWGIALWVLITDARAPVSPLDPCAYAGDKCSGRRLFRSCFNTDAEIPACDEITVAPIGNWITYSRNIRNAFASKYGSAGFTPARITVTFAMFSADQQSEVCVCVCVCVCLTLDLCPRSLLVRPSAPDIFPPPTTRHTHAPSHSATRTRWVTHARAVDVVRLRQTYIDDFAILSLIKPAGSDCPAIRAESLAFASKWVNIPTSSITDWEMRSSPVGGVAVTGLAASATGGAITIAGPAAPGVPQTRVSHVMFTSSLYEEKRIVSFEMRVKAGTVNSSTVTPALLACDRCVVILGARLLSLSSRLLVAALLQLRLWSVVVMPLVLGAEMRHHLSSHLALLPDT